jgi:hypothetical protein
MGEKIIERGGMGAQVGVDDVCKNAGSFLLIQDLKAVGANALVKPLIRLAKLSTAELTRVTIRIS